MSDLKVTIAPHEGGAETIIAQMDESQLYCIGKDTYNFVRRIMRNPECRAMIKARAEQIRATAGSSANRTA